AGRKEAVLTDELLSETFQLPIKVHWENNRPWVSIHKNISSTK
ncbi:MAG: molybdenum ABC transporter ATP-binding protein, partial [Parageobacillus thermoglucosidasius]|nr:molybdenum ABC transporter ATP-binding protein [Parageobacillus thermoglucosidasius]